MRVAFAMINCNRRDGSARAVNEVAERLARRGHDVHLFARTVTDLDLDAVRWHRVPGPGWPEVADFWSYHQIVNRRLAGGFDIVHSIGCNTLRANVVTIQNIQPVKARILKELAPDERVSPARRLTRWLYLRVTSEAERRLYTAVAGRRSPVFLPVSNGVAGELRRTYRIGSAKVRIVPNAADTKIFQPLDDIARTEWRREAGFSDSDFVCVFSGGEWARKGLDLAIRAIGLIRDPSVKLYVAGDDPDRGRFSRMAAEWSSRVVFGGFRHDIPKVLGAGDIFLFPSRYEAFSLATIEAAACGLPIVAAKINGTEDFIQPGHTGEFVGHDPQEIADAVLALACDRQRVREMGSAGRERVVANYTWDRVADLTEVAYREALE
ncbi:MAG: glycosyltransferase family 4 protein [Terrimicrobiaceae bacterium]|nr:glycosyltransferase family 4 protein [Terrimicrobiaceae bacterium]